MYILNIFIIKTKFIFLLPLGLDMVRRDWSRLAGEAGQFTLKHILSDQSQEERVENIQNHLIKLKEDLEQNKVPLSLLVITKQLTKEPKNYPNKNSLPHVQVALRYNQKGGKAFRAGDTVPYVICEDGTNNSPIQRAYHVDELKQSEKLKIDVKYYLAQQIYPVVSRLCEPIEEIDSFVIAECLGMDSTSIKKLKRKNENIVEIFKRSEEKFNGIDPFTFICISCKSENKVKTSLVNGVPFLQKCSNLECNMKPLDYLPSIQNQLVLNMRGYIFKYYRNELTCEDPACSYETVRLPVRFAGKYPVCTFCKRGVMFKKYSECELYKQLRYFRHIFDLSKIENSKYFFSSFIFNT